MAFARLQLDDAQNRLQRLLQTSIYKHLMRAMEAVWVPSAAVGPLTRARLTFLATVGAATDGRKLLHPTSLHWAWEQGQHRHLDLYRHIQNDSVGKGIVYNNITFLLN